MLQFSCRFAFLSTFRLSNQPPKITQILKITRHTACQHGTVQKEDKIWIKSLHEYKGYNAQQFITEFSDKGWTKNSINRLLVKLSKFGTA